MGAGGARTRIAVRAGLLSFGLIQLLLGLYAVLAPRSFYDDFPFGRGWVAALPDYSEHLVRDVGGLFLATAVILLAAAAIMERRLVLIALGSFLAFTIPHTLFHVFNLEAYDSLDTALNVALLVPTVLVPAALFALVLRRG